jgi:hypothetical protein
MRGCLRGFERLLLIAALLALAWFTRDRWMPLLRHGGGASTGATSPAAAPVPAGPPWDLVTAEAAAQGKAAILKLGQKTGPVFANLSGAEFTAYVVDELSRQLPPSAMGTTAQVIGDELHIRAMVRPSDFGAEQVLGPLAKMLGERESMELGGTLDVVRPGLAALTVRTLKFRDLSVPGPGIPTVLARMQTGARPALIGSDALALVLPVQVADIRVRNGRITLYKAGQ